ncbi:MAG: deoxyribonuclease IV [Candidatus Omnitrophica bacterium]|nr:deoxyribonuclease IV [Candidatus Omnitrophota bacterium]MDD5429238.1 deoxyribonuclease IV [Candidatus Omnitrophota bacterium]
MGVHVSIAGTIDKSIDRAKLLGCNTMQIFSRNPRQWRKSFLESQDVDLFIEKAKKADIKPLAIHIPYTLNLASAKKSFYKVTIREFIADLTEAGQLKADYLVTHVGSFKGGTEKGGLLRVINALNKILKETKAVKTKVLLENTSGSGHWLGHNFSQLKFIFEGLNWNERVGICLDTAHAWAAGYKINAPETLEEFVKEIETEIGIDRLGLIHLNDTKEVLGSLQDRHCAIGAGKIGRKGFSFIINHPKFKGVPFILETPKETEADDLKNLKVVRKLYK